MAFVCESVRTPTTKPVSWWNLQQKKIGAVASKVPQTYILAAALFVAFLPFDDTQLIFLVVGALFYLLVYRMQSRVNVNVKGKHYLHNKADNFASTPVGASKASRQAARQPSVQTSSRLDGSGSKAVTWQAIAPPTFSVTGFEAEVKELMHQILPSQRDEKAVQDITMRVHQALAATYPDIEVLGYCTGDLNRGKAFGVAVPDVDIIINLNPAMLASSVSSRNSDPDNDLMKIYKATLRSCTEKLVSKGGFKFRRSAFRGSEPKVTLLTPNVVGDLQHAVPMDFSINTTVPMYYSSLLADCELLDPRAKELIMLVKRWAKDRGVCHAAKGYLSPYLWCVMVVYFLQQRAYDAEPVLPMLEAFPTAAGLVGAGRPAVKLAEKQAAMHTQQHERAQLDKHVGTLFKEFVHYFHAIFDWSHGVIAISDAAYSVDIEGVALRIVDPFEGQGDLSAYLSKDRLVRIREEFARASELCRAEASLVQLLELWMPPESKEAGENDKD
eukprot:TRINITY_DN6265_c0_g1_i1.p1 TRINITY_DN6265_c0_g1~~TRINITY_DN6265_c0_g1_i1.p1  ORF type:complete len:538 (+),score=113.01 TRINITY_DN6265_c0_g1_i1:119-1615(+)